METFIGRKEKEYLTGIGWKSGNDCYRLYHSAQTYINDTCIAVGQVSPLGAYLLPQGDFHLEQAPESFRDTKLRFSLVRPDDGVRYFRDEFDESILALNSIAFGLPRNKCPNSFVTCDSNGVSMNFSWNIFEDVSIRQLFG